MKNFYALLIVISLGLVISACSNNPLIITNEDEETEVIESSESDNFDFRKATWGMTKKEVMQTEQGEPVFNSEYKIDYDTQMLGFNSKVGYTFKDDELVRASFLLAEEPKTNDDYIEIYKKIQKKLRKKYGKTVIDTIQYRDPSQSIEPENYADAICRGELLYATQWDTPSSDIQLLLRGEDSECIVTIMYISEEGFRQMLREGNNNQ